MSLDRVNRPGVGLAAKGANWSKLSMRLAELTASGVLGTAVAGVFGHAFRAGLGVTLQKSAKLTLFDGVLGLLKTPV